MYSSIFTNDVWTDHRRAKHQMHFTQKIQSTCVQCILISTHSNANAPAIIFSVLHNCYICTYMHYFIPTSIRILRAWFTTTWRTNYTHTLSHARRYAPIAWARTHRTAWLRIRSIKSAHDSDARACGIAAHDRIIRARASICICICTYMN